MNLTVLREAATVVCFLLFIGIICWAWARSNRARFDEAARLPFEQD